MVDPKGKAQQKQRSGCSFRNIKQTRHLLNKVLLPSLATCACYPSASPSSTHTIQHTPHTGLILQPGPLCISSQAVRLGHGSGKDAPSSLNSEGLLATWTIKMWIKTCSPSKCQVLAVSGTCTALPGAAIVTCTDTTEVMKAQGSAQTASKLWQPTAKSVLLQHQTSQATLE